MPSSIVDGPSPAAACAGLILMYHRISVTPTDPWALGVGPAHFEQHLDVLRRYYDPVPLADIADATRPGRAVTVTFDDGYVDNLRIAAPLLARYDVPATVFVTTGSIGSGREYWWDELERLLLEPIELPDEPGFGSMHGDETRPLGPARVYTHAERQRDRTWLMQRQGAPSARLALFRDIHARLMPMPDTGRRAALDGIARWSGDRGRAGAALRCMSGEELSELAGYGSIEIGAHTVTHAQLPSLSASAQSFEIGESRSVLQTIVGREVASFSFPYGLFNDQAKRIVQDAGFHRACSTRSHGVAVGGDAWELPRIKIGDWDGATFETVLAQHLRS